MDFVFVPSECKGDKKKFTGSITLQALSTTQKFRLMSKCDFEMTEDGVAKKSMKQLSALADLIDAVKPYFKAVDIKSIDGKKHYKSVEDLEYNDECATMLIEAATQFLNGFKLGNATLPT